jgi:uncharacterized HAD superfamily protein
MKIGIDIDNVIANTFQDLIPHYNRFMKRQDSPLEVIETMRREKLKMLQYYFRAWRTRIMTSVSLMEGAAGTIRKWHQQHKIKLITSRLFLFNRQTRRWLKKHDIPFHELHHAKEKTKYQKGRDCRVFIEDNLDECEVLANHCEKVFLIDHPWNQRQPRQNNIIRVKNWDDLQKLI